MPKNKIDWSPITPYLGVISDYAIAKRYGIRAALISKYRRRHGIPAVNPIQYGPKQQLVPPGNLIERLGNEPEKRLADEFGLSVLEIKKLRLRFNVPAYVPPRDTVRHGSTSAYIKRRCNCDICKDAYVQHYKQRRLKRRNINLVVK